MRRGLVLLRGINLGPHNRLPMTRWIELLQALGATEVTTVLQSGSAVISYEGEFAGFASAHRDQLEEVIGKRIVVDVWEGADVLRLRTEVPEELWGLDSSKVLVHFLSRVLSDEEQASIAALIERDVWFGRGALFQSCPTGVHLAPDLSAILQRRVPEISSTARNLRTFERIVALLARS